MTLVDTSVWIHHFRRGVGALVMRLEEGVVLCHPFIIGELACGAWPTRDESLVLLQRLPQIPVVRHEEALELIEQWKLMGSGIGWIDAHLLASVLLAGADLWTLDRRLGRAAKAVGVQRAG